MKAAVGTNARRGDAVQVTVIDHKCGGCGALMRFSASGTPYYKSTSLTGKKNETKFIARPAAGPFECGECREGSKKQASSDRLVPRSDITTVVMKIRRQVNSHADKYVPCQAKGAETGRG